MSGVLVRVDEISDVFYARRENTSSAFSNEAPNDGYLVISYDAGGNIVGIKLMAASEMPHEFWRRHPDRGVIPPDLLDAIDAWVQSRQAH